MKFTLAIVGRPNVGKSTLFNRLARRRLALVAPEPGLTRDRREADIELDDHLITLVDTAGLEEAESGTLAARMRAQSERAIADADLVLFVIDARTGITPADESFAKLVRATGKPCIVVANKAEGRAGEAGYYEAYAFGLGEPVAISAEHGEGLGELYARIAAELETLEKGTPPEDVSAKAEAREGAIRVAIIGRPNVGKSTLANALFGEERVITGPEPGLTRDSISLDVTWKGQPVKLFDTAGLRRRARIENRAEKLSVADALRAVRFAEVVIVLLDATRAFEKQDLHIADLAAQEGRAIVIAVNKWDLVHGKRAREVQIREAVDRLLPQIKGVPIVPISALKKMGLNKLKTETRRIHEVWNRRLPTAELNRWLAGAIAAHPPPALRGRRIKLRFITQPSARPPRFVIFCSRPEDLPEAYERYLTNSLREAFKLWGVPIRIYLRKGKNPYRDQG